MDELEQWRDIPGFPDYEVSSEGRVRSYRRGMPRILKPGKCGSRREYLVVRLADEDGQFQRVKVHAAMLTAFVGPRPNGAETRHLNGVADDNRLVNLAWGTRADNVADKRRHGHLHQGEQVASARLTRAQVIEARAAAREGATCRELARRYGVAKTTMRQLLLGLTWRHLPGALAELPRPYPGLTDEQIRQARQAREAGATYESLARNLGCAYSSVWEAVNSTRALVANDMSRLSA